MVFVSKITDEGTGVRLAYLRDLSMFLLITGTLCFGFYLVPCPLGSVVAQTPPGMYETDGKRAATRINQKSFETTDTPDRPPSTHSIPGSYERQELQTPDFSSYLTELEHL